MRSGELLNGMTLLLVVNITGKLMSEGKFPPVKLMRISEIGVAGVSTRGSLGTT